MNAYPWMHKYFVWFGTWNTVGSPSSMVIVSKCLLPRLWRSCLYCWNSAFKRNLLRRIRITQVAIVCLSWEQKAQTRGFLKFDTGFHDSVAALYRLCCVLPGTVGCPVGGRDYGPFGAGCCGGWRSDILSAVPSLPSHTVVLPGSLSIIPVRGITQLGIWLLEGVACSGFVFGRRMLLDDGTEMIYVGIS